MNTNHFLSKVELWMWKFWIASWIRIILNREQNGKH